MNKITEKLIELQDEKYREFNKKLCPDTKLEFLGIRVPVLRKLAKEITKNKNEEWKKFLNIDVKFFEERLLQGLIIGYADMSLEEKLEYIEKYVPNVDSWALTDSFIPTLKIRKNDLEKYWKFICDYINSEKEFEIRFAVVSMLDYFIIDEYVDKVIDILNNISHDGYYVKMAVAWTIAEIGIKYNNKAMFFLQNENNLDKFTYNKSLQKMIESFRIDTKQKDLLRKMKRR